MKRILILLIGLFILTCCKKTGPQGPAGEQGSTGPAGATATGTISGKVTQFDNFSTELTTELNTVTVSIKGTTLSSVTDEKGNYRISSVPAGVYILDFKGKKTQSCLYHQVSCAGAGIAYYHINLYEKPNWTFTNMYIRDSLEMHAVVVTSLVTPTVVAPPGSSSVQREYLVLFSRDTSLTNIDPSSYDLASFVPGPKFSLYYGSPFLPTYPTGTVYYAKIYSVTSRDVWYFDPKTKQKVYYSVGDAAPKIFKLTVPSI